MTLLKYKNIIVLISICVFAGFLLFSNLGYSSVFDWDEARNAENALEILKTKDWLVTKYGGTPDLWNLKPPLGAWLEATTFNLFGISKFAMRFWSALAAFCTVIVVFLTGVKIKNVYVGFISVLVLLSIDGFVGFHGGQTGDYDTLVTFFITLALVLFYFYQQERKQFYLVGVSAAISFGFLTKGIVGLLPIPIIALYTLYLTVISQKVYFKGWQFAVFLFLILPTNWLISRYIAGKEFVLAMINFDLKTRISLPVEGHIGYPMYYIDILRSNLGDILSLYLLFFFGYAVLLVFKKQTFPALLVIWIMVILAVFTRAETKLSWYLLPLYPATSLLLGWGFSDFVEYLKPKSSSMFNTVSLLIIALLLMLINFDIPRYQDPQQESLWLLGTYLKDTDNLYVPHELLSQSYFFILSSQVRGQVIGYKGVGEIEAKSTDAVLINNQEVTPNEFLENYYKKIGSNGFFSLFQLSQLLKR